MGTVEGARSQATLVHPVERRLGPDTRNVARRNVSLGVAAASTVLAIGAAIRLAPPQKGYAAIPAAIAGVAALIGFGDVRDKRPTGRVIAEGTPGDHVLSIAREAGGIVNVIPEPGREGLTLFTSSEPMTSRFVNDGVPLELGNNVGGWPLGSDPDYNLDRRDDDRFASAVADSRFLTSKERTYLGSVNDLRTRPEASAPGAA